MKGITKTPELLSIIRRMGKIKKKLKNYPNVNDLMILEREYINLLIKGDKLILKQINDSNE